MKSRRTKKDDIMGGYKYLRSHQIKARIEAFKRGNNNCKKCLDSGICEFVMMSKCKGTKPRLD